MVKKWCVRCCRFWTRILRSAERCGVVFRLRCRAHKRLLTWSQTLSQIYISVTLLTGTPWATTPTCYFYTFSTLLLKKKTQSRKLLTFWIFHFRMSFSMRFLKSQASGIFRLLARFCWVEIYNCAIFELISLEKSFCPVLFLLLQLHASTTSEVLALLRLQVAELFFIIMKQFPRRLSGSWIPPCWRRQACAPRWWHCWWRIKFFLSWNGRPVGGSCAEILGQNARTGKVGA